MCIYIYICIYIYPFLPLIPVKWVEQRKDTSSQELKQSTLLSLLLNDTSLHLYRLLLYVGTFFFFENQYMLVLGTG